MFPDADGNASVFSPFASEEISPPFSPHWEAKRRAAQALRELIEALVTSDASTAEIDALADLVETQAATLAAGPRLHGLLAFLRDGKHGGHGVELVGILVGIGLIIGALAAAGMTGTLTVRYHRPTPLNTDLDLSAQVQESVGRKTMVSGELHAGDVLTASCECLFVRPKQPLLQAT